MQPFSQDPTNPTGQSSFSFSSEQSSVPPQQDSISPTGQLYQPSPYPQTEPQFAPPPPLSSPQGSYPLGEEAYYRQKSQDGGPITQYRASTQGKLDVPPVPPKPRNAWKVVSLALFILVLILATATTTLVLTRPSSSVGQQIGQTVPTSVATQPIAVPTSAPTQAAQPTPSSSNNYSAPQPGPGCDTSGGAWTPQGITNFSCGTQVVPVAARTWGYLYLQLPNNAPFAANNKITVSADFSNSDSVGCIGLAEQDTNTGVLVSYCASGKWAISLISSNKGAVTQTLMNNVTATKRNTTISLTMNGNALTFAIDTETHQYTITPIQPVKVAIGFNDDTCATCFVPYVMANNFSYITPAS